MIGVPKYNTLQSKYHIVYIGHTGGDLQGDLGPAVIGCRDKDCVVYLSSSGIIRNGGKFVIASEPTSDSLVNRFR